MVRKTPATSLRPFGDQLLRPITCTEATSLPQRHSRCFQATPVCFPSRMLPQVCGKRATTVTGESSVTSATRARRTCERYKGFSGDLVLITGVRTPIPLVRSRGQSLGHGQPPKDTDCERRNSLLTYKGTLRQSASSARPFQPDLIELVSKDEAALAGLPRIHWGPGRSQKSP